jgi:PAS domain S-box-containing protein
VIGFRKRRPYESVLLDELGRARFMARHTGEAFVAVNDRQEIVYISTEAEDLLGWMTEEIAGRPLSVIQPQRYRRRHAEGFERIRKEGVEKLKVLFEDTHFEALHRDGHDIPVTIATAAWRSPEGHLYFLAAMRQEEREIQL